MKVVGNFKVADSITLVPQASTFNFDWATPAMANLFYSSCADVLSVCQANKQDLDALLDPKTGFASRLRDLCEEQCVQPPSSVCETNPA